VSGVPLTVTVSTRRHGGHGVHGAGGAPAGGRRKERDEPRSQVPAGSSGTCDRVSSRSLPRYARHRPVQDRHCGWRIQHAQTNESTSPCSSVSRFSALTVSSGASVATVQWKRLQSRRSFAKADLSRRSPVRRRTRA